MKLTQKLIPLVPLLALVALLSNCATPATMSSSASGSTIEANAKKALNDLYSQNSAARNIGRQADSVLVFPTITKAGFVVGGATGNGALLRNGRATGYYNSTGISYGLQAGAQQFGYAVFVMDDAALAKLNSQRGWEIGSAPSLVVVDSGMSGSLSSTTLQKGLYAFFFNQRGLMAGLGLQGTKVTRIIPKQ